MLQTCGASAVAGATSETIAASAVAGPTTETSGVSAVTSVLVLRQERRAPADQRQKLVVSARSLVLRQKLVVAMRSLVLQQKLVVPARLLVRWCYDK